MHQVLSLVAIAAVSALGACTAPGPATSVPTAATLDACGASHAQHAVGTTSAEADPILQEASQAAGGSYRIVEYGQPTTMEFNERRLTARVGRDGMIETVDCG